MKRILMLLLAVFMISVSLAQLNDVPVNHWAYDSVKKLVEMKILSGFPDGTFRGNDPLTRYQTAVALDRLMQYLETRIDASVDASLKNELAQLRSQSSDLRKRTETIEAVLEGLVNTLRNLDENYGQLSDELTQLKSSLENLKSQVVPPVTEEAVDKKIADKITTFASQLNSSVAQLEARLTARMDQLEKGYTQDLADLNAKLKALEVDLQETKAEIVKMSDSFASQKAMENLVKDLSSQITDIRSQTTALAEQASKLEPMTTELSRYGVDIESLKQRVGSVESIASNLSKNLESVQAQLKEFATRFASLENKDAELETRLSSLESTPFASQIDVMKDVIIGVSKNVDELSQRVQALESNSATVALINQEVKVLRSRMDLNFGQLAEIKVTLNNHQKIITQLNTKIDQQAASVKNLETELSNLKSEVNAVSTSYKTALDKASEALNETEKLRREMEKRASIDDVNALAEDAQSAKSTAKQAQILGWFSTILSLLAAGMAVMYMLSSP